MRFVSLAAAAFALLASFPAAAQDAAASAGGPPALSRSDREFLRNAAESSLAQVQGSELALQVAQGEDTKRFARQMVQDHTAANAQLAALARRKGAELPAAPGLVEQGRFKLLQMSKGMDFDQRFAEDGVRAHQGTIALFQQQAERGHDPELRRFAGQVLPQLRMHLQMAQQLQAQLSAQAGDNGTAMGSGSAPER